MMANDIRRWMASAFFRHLSYSWENPGKTSIRKTDPTGDWTRARYVRGNDVTSGPEWWSPFYTNYDGHVVHRRSETIAVCKCINMIWMMNEGRMIPMGERGINLLIFALQLRKISRKSSPRKLTRNGIEPGPSGWETTTLPRNHSGVHYVVKD